MALTTIADIASTVYVHAFLQCRLRAAGERVPSGVVGGVDTRDAVLVSIVGSGPMATVDTVASTVADTAASRVAQAAAAVEHARAASERDAGVRGDGRAAAVVSVVYSLEGHGVAVQTERGQFVAEGFLACSLQSFVLHTDSQVIE